ncbi:hypothetical protein Y032_0073g740 [Ancylostoma ceylanicum]|nr:hypothetical protein Y032_0073g740 [Ancylostoma ceylanicum]
MAELIVVQTGEMKKAVKWGLLAAVVVAVIAAIIAVVLVLVLKKKDEAPSERVMYFAMHLGDEGALYRNRDEKYRSSTCSLHVNVDNTQSSIEALKNSPLKYSFILYTDKIETTAPMSSDEAMKKLDSIEAKAHESPFNQEAVLNEFASRSANSLLVYYIPCSFNYDQGEVKKFVEEVKKAGLEKKILIVSNTRPEEEVKRLYEQDSVAGSDTENVAEKIIHFGNGEKPTVGPIGTKTTSKPAHTTTKPTQKSTKPTRPPGPTPDPNGLHCLFVGDLYNFGSHADRYEKEAQLFGDIGYDFFEESSISRIGLWAYGHTKYAKKPDLSQMSHNLEGFMEDLDNMEYQYNSDPLKTENAIGIINGLQDDGNMVNCLVFFSAQQDTYSLPKLDPQNKKIKRIVAVGYNDTDLSGVVGSRGVAVSVPYYYLDEDVFRVISAIMGRPVTTTTTRKTVPTQKRTTTRATPRPSTGESKCLIVGDLYNFGKDTDKYEVEVDLLDKIGYDFLLESDGSNLQLALWAYGYTEFSKTVNDSLKTMHKKYDDYSRALEKMEYTSVSNPWSSERAIQAINEMHDRQERVNCLVFVSAQQNPQGLPKLNPNNMNFDRIIAVGFNGVDLRHIVPANGFAYKVPFNYLDGDITPIVNAMLGRSKPITTKKPTTKPTTVPPSSDPPKCLVVGDMYNFGKDTDKYDVEVDMLDKIGYDFLLGSDGDRQLALWAYGYTQISKTVNDSLRTMNKNYDEFSRALDKMEYMDVYDPWTTAKAIKAINEMYDSQKRVNCLVFVSAEKNPQSLPKLNPRNMNFEKIIAVGFNGVDLKNILPANGVAFKVPFNYLDEDLTPIVKAMLGRYKPTTVTTKKPTTRTTAPPMTSLKCLFVGDLYNFGSILADIDVEAQFLSDLAYDYFGLAKAYKAGLWAYGFTHYPTMPNLKKMSTNYADFEEELAKMEFYDTDNYVTTSRAIEIINRMMDDGSGANCLVFISAQKNTEVLPRLNPLYKKWGRIVAVGFNNTDLSDVVYGTGVAVRVPFNYLDEHVTNVMNAILGKVVPKTTPVPYSTPRPQPTTPVPPGSGKNCLLVADMSNFGRDKDKYDIERDLLAKVGFDFFAESNISTVALWAYGYTRYQNVEESLDKLIPNYKELAAELEKMIFYDTTNPFTTERAIEAINAMRDYQNRVNCLVFVSAQKNTYALPKLNPRNTNIKTIVAVGYDGTNVQNIVPDDGVALTVPLHFFDSHVEAIVSAMFGRYRPTAKPTTKRPVTTPKPKTFKCLFVGDVFGYAKNQEGYDLEADLIADVAHDLYSKYPGSTIGLWAYGYTNFSRHAVSALRNMRKNYNDLISDLNKMVYYETDAPLSTGEAIEQLNQLSSSKDIVNCMVFFSADRDVGVLPMIYPVYLVDHFVAVGLNNTDLSSRVHPAIGIPVSVPAHYVDEDVKTIFDAITQKKKPTPKPTTTRVTTTTGAPPSKAPVHCLFVGDLYSYEHNVEDYELEGDLMDAVAHDLFAALPQSSLGLWAYGYTNFSKDPTTSLGKIRKNYNDFKGDMDGFGYVRTGDPLKIEAAIKALNAMRDNNKRINCLVFFSPTKKADELPTINPEHLGLEKVVAVGLDDAELNDLLPSNGIAVSIPKYFLDSHVTRVVNAIMSRPVPKTTRKPTTLAPTGKVPKCLFVGDLYNYEHDVPSYELEADFMDAVAYDIFGVNSQSSLGLWAYGYTNYSKQPSTSLEKMRSNYKDFKGDLDGFGYVRTSDPLATKAAIEAINAMRDNARRINCLVFYSSTKRAYDLPKINLEHLEVETVVAVGLDYADLSAVLPNGGVSIPVSKHFLDSDVTRVVNAIMENYAPKTTKSKPTTTTAKPPETVPECLFVGDLYNFKEDLDAYESEAELLDFVAHDLFGVSSRSSLALWAYGHTNFSKYPAPSLLKMRNNYKDFKGDLDGFWYIKSGDPLSTKGAIEALNLMRDDFDHINCLVFYSAAKNTDGLPKIDPDYLNLNKIVAVGLDNADLSALLPANGVAVSVPKYFIDSDVERIVNAIVKKPVTTTTSKPTTTAPPPLTPDCLIVADLYNFEDDLDAYELEAEFIDAIGYDLFGSVSPKSKLGLWAYGYTNLTFPSTALLRMRSKYEDFKKDLSNMDYIKVEKPLTTEKAITAINIMRDTDKRINCLVFLSAVKDTSNLPQINPDNLELERIIAVGLDNADLNALVPYNGVALSVPQHFFDSDVKRVLDAIMGKIKPATTKKPIVTTAEPKVVRNCLIVGDLANFGKNEDDYDLEAELIDAVGYDVFGASPTSTLGLWLYGHTRKVHPNSALLRMRKNYTAFKKDVDEIELKEVDDPLTTRGAIYAINSMRDSDKRINCLVFLSADKNTNDLPQINPENLQLERIVAVGLDDANLKPLIPSNGVAISVPKHFFDSDVKRITDAIMERVKPPTTTPKPKTTTTAPIKPMDCLIVGDLYNFAHNYDFYDKEADFIDAVGYDLFDVAPGSSVGLWAYGYSNFSSDPKTTLDKIRKKYDDFKSDLDKFENYPHDYDVVSTKKAIDALNAMRDSGKRINCLVFLSGTRIAAELPQLNPRELKLDRVVAVGLNSQILDPLVAGHGVAVSIPEDYFDSDVKLVIDAIMGRIPPVTTKKPPTTTEIPPKPMDCLLVGDLYNFGHQYEFYEVEADLIEAVGYDLFDVAPGSSLGLWAYGYSNFSTEPSTSLEKIRKQYDDFKKDLDEFKHYPHDDHVVSTGKAIVALNKMRDNGKRINCLIFLSGTRVAAELPKLNPRQLNLERIVAVGLNSQILDPLVEGHGVSVSVPDDFLDHHVKVVIDAIMGRIPPLTTTKPLTTTTPPPIPVDCLLVGDLYNFEANEEAYETEADLIEAVSYDVFDFSPQSSLGLWAYGYTSFPEDPSSSLRKMRRNFGDFKKDLDEFVYDDGNDDPLTTKTAIEAINAMRDNERRIKCLVFLSAAKDTKGLPQINPQHLNLERIVAVGLNNANLDALVPYNFGVSIRVPENFLDTDVKRVIDAMMGRIKPFTTKAPPTTVAPPIKPHCLFVADFFSFGDDVDGYDAQATLMDEAGYDLFDINEETTLGLWAFGYTNYSKDPNTSLEKMRKEYGDFEEDLNALEYFKIADPLKTSKAIEAINNMRDDQKRINCLVFFSAA